mmetsp:Transcript_104594/g.145786  ORF Transcript_104594/g.145786 Transcript_104594/m.145786 type:complete len:204 (-) Transcript_104594:453-1064(-)
MTEVAPTVRQIRRSSNLEEILRAMILYLFKKCKAMSLMAPPTMTTSTPTSLMPRISSSIFCSSPLLKFMSCSALSNKTVPFVSVEPRSSASAYTATLAFSLNCSTPLVRRAMAMPSTTNELFKLPPCTFVTRTLSTSNLLGTGGMTWAQASATSFARGPSQPNCLDAMAVLTQVVSWSTLFRSVHFQQTCSFKKSSALSLASS